MAKGWIGVDLDGTLANYTKFGGIENIGPPIPKMLERVKQFLGAGQTVKIFTARVSDPRFEPYGRQAIEQWCQRWIGQVLEITNVKDFGMTVLYDDRAIQVEHNTGELTVEVLARRLLKQRKYQNA